jgi:hypothetical protein
MSTTIAPTQHHKFELFFSKARVVALCRCGTSRTGTPDNGLDPAGGCPGPTVTGHTWVLSGHADGVAAACPNCGIVRAGPISESGGPAGLLLDLSGECSAVGNG